MKSFWQRAYDWLAGLGRYIKKIVLDIMTDAVKDFINRMGPEIEDILKEIQADPKIILSGERRQAAFDKILSAAKKHGIDTVEESVVYMAIEMILNALKNTGELGGNVGAKSTKAKSKGNKKK